MNTHDKHINCLTLILPPKVIFSKHDSAEVITPHSVNEQKVNVCLFCCVTPLFLRSFVVLLCVVAENVVTDRLTDRQTDKRTDQVP